MPNLVFVGAAIPAADHRPDLDLLIALQPDVTGQDVLTPHHEVRGLAEAELAEQVGHRGGGDLSNGAVGQDRDSG